MLKLLSMSLNSFCSVLHGWQYTTTPHTQFAMERIALHCKQPTHRCDIGCTADRESGHKIENLPQRQAFLRLPQTS